MTLLLLSLSILNKNAEHKKHIPVSMLSKLMAMKTTNIIKNTPKMKSISFSIILTFNGMNHLTLHRQIVLYQQQTTFWVNMYMAI